MQGLIPILEIKGRKDYFASQLECCLTGMLIQWEELHLSDKGNIKIVCIFG